MFSMQTARGQDCHGINGFALHHRIHIRVEWDAEAITIDLGTIWVSVAHGSQDSLGDRPMPQQFRMALCNSPATD
jgi:hypothetical protein